MKKLLLISWLLLASCQAQPPAYQLFTQTTFEVGFDTAFQLIAETKDEAEFQFYYNLMLREGQYFHQLFDSFNEEPYPNINNIKTINEQAGIAPVKVAQPIIDLLVLARKWTNETAGAFDVTLGALTDIWHEYREMGIIYNNRGERYLTPPLAELEQAKKHTGWQNVEIDEVNQTVFIKNSKLSLDVGAIAKGYAVEKLSETLIAAGLTHGIINGGGNVKILGPKRNGDTWGLGIESPKRDNQSLDVIKTTANLVMVTSGDYQRFYIDEHDVRQHHLIDPSTLFPSQGKRAVVIILNDSGLADILSTAFFINSYEWGLDFVKTYNQAHPAEPIGVIWITEQPLAEVAEVAVQNVNGLYLTYTNNLLPYSKLFQSKNSQ